jgi:hypothetical protein
MTAAVELIADRTVCQAGARPPRLEMRLVRDLTRVNVSVDKRSAGLVPTCGALALRRTGTGVRYGPRSRPLWRLT